MQNQVSRKDIVTEARKWIDTPWKHQGRTKLGIDCAGLIILVGKTLNLVDYDTTDYQRRTHGTEFLHHFRKNMNQKSVLSALPGDVLIFRDSKFPCHSTIVSENNNARTIIHAFASRKKVIEERLDQGDWMSKVVACFEYKGLND